MLTPIAETHSLRERLSKDTPTFFLSQVVMYEVARDGQLSEQWLNS